MKQKNSQAKFFVGDIPINGDVILSPMDGFSDFPFRRMCRRLGSAMSYTEFINANTILHRDLEDLSKLQFEEAERPIVFQIFDNDVDNMEKAALKLMVLKPDIIDINMGCSAPSVANKGSGAGLLRDPKKIGEIFKRLSKTLTIPVTGKIRIGWDEENLNYLEVSKIIEDNGGQLVAVHGRTKVQAYLGNANWDAIAEIKQAVSIPVIGNGDIKTVEDIGKMKAYTNCDGVMIGRAAIGNPWIFNKQNRTEVSMEQVRRAMDGHLKDMLAFHGEERGLRLFRKHTKKYISPFGLPRKIRIAILTCENIEDFNTLLDDMEEFSDFEIESKG
jgi:tRNA-dihydrouridine synthase B